MRRILKSFKRGFELWFIYCSCWLDCPDVGSGPPIPFIPDSAKTVFKFSLSEIANITCGAIFGVQCNKESGGTYCTLNWTRTGDRQCPIPECSDNSILGTCYTINAPYVTSKLLLMLHGLGAHPFWKLCQANIAFHEYQIQLKDWNKNIWNFKYNCIN